MAKGYLRARMSNINLNPMLCCVALHVNPPLKCQVVSEVCSMQSLFKKCNLGS